MKKASVGITIIVLSVIACVLSSCTKEIIQPVRIEKEIDTVFIDHQDTVFLYDTVQMSPNVPYEVDLINAALKGNWKTVDYNITRSTDLNKERFTYAYDAPFICEVLDTLLPDKDLVKSYQVVSSETAHELKVAKRYRCSDRVEIVKWEVRLSQDINSTNSNLVTGTPFIILEKNDFNVVIAIHTMTFFNLTNQPNQFTPLNRLSLETIFRSDLGIYSYIQVNTGFSKEQ